MNPTSRYPGLHWEEPEDWARYRTHVATSKPLLARLARALWFFVRSCGVFFIPWLLLRLLRFPTISAEGYLIAAAFGASVFTLLHWVRATYPVPASKISFTDNGIIQYFPKQEWRCNYLELDGWAVIDREFQGHILHILLLKLLVKGRTYDEAFALPDAIIRDKVVQMLRDKHVPEASDLKPSWEAE